MVTSNINYEVAAIHHLPENQIFVLYIIQNLAQNNKKIVFDKEKLGVLLEMVFQYSLYSFRNLKMQNFMTNNIFVYQDRVSLCSIEAYPGVSFVDQVGLELGDLPASAS